jgi:hypothetical protein
MREPTPAPPSCSHVALVAVVLASRPARCRSDDAYQRFCAWMPAEAPTRAARTRAPSRGGENRGGWGRNALWRGLATAWAELRQRCAHLDRGRLTPVRQFFPFGGVRLRVIPAIVTPDGSMLAVQPEG